MKCRWLVVITAALALGACKTSSSAETGAKATAAGAEEAPATSRSPAQTSSFAAPPLDGTPAAVGLRFSGDELHVAREDGSFSTWSTSSESARESGALRGNRAPLAWSPDGALAIVDGTPPVIVRIEDGREVLRFVKVDSVATAGFFPDGSGLFVGEPNGELHVWNESVETLTSVPTENLEAFIARQSPSFSANFSSLAGDATVTDSNELLLGTQSGKLYWWDPQNPTRVKTLVKLPSSIRDTAVAGGTVFATTRDGDFRAATTASGEFLEWSRGVPASFVAAAAGAPTQILVADSLSVRMLATEDGSELWRRALPDDANVCGLELSADAQTGAVCIDGGVVVFDAEGTVVGTMP